MSGYKATIVVQSTTRGYGESKREIPGAVVSIEASIDWDRLFTSLGTKAYRSKGKRTAALGGKIKVKVTQVKELRS
jgi:hypothetical protein